MPFLEEISIDQLRTICSSLSYDKELASFFGKTVPQLKRFLKLHPEIDVHSWYRIPKVLSLRWLKQQDSTSLNSFFCKEYHLLGYAAFYESIIPTI